MSIEVKSRFAVFSDVHANLAALQKFLKDAQARGIEQYFCLGDIVGYGPRPNECCEIVREMDIPVVLGNHDYACLHEEDRLHFNDIARQAIEWTADQLNAENREWLSSLPCRIDAGDYTFVHASACKPSEWTYVISRKDVDDCFEAFQNSVCFIGHSHQPFVVIEDDKGQMQFPEQQTIQKKGVYRYLVNVGSIGQPRDQDARLCYFLVDQTESLMSFIRVDYPIEETQKEINAAGLPIQLANRIEKGW
ncbi:MAG: metallophosphoesterase family protein [Candidatus Sumerlaeia bacterium]